MTERIRTYRERILNTKPTICTERAFFYTKAYKKHQDKPVILKRAYALKNTLDGMSIRIEAEDLIVGNHSSAIYAAPIFPEYAVEWIRKEINDFENRPGDTFYPDRKTKEDLISICDYWDNQTTLDKGRALLTDDLLAIHESGIIRAEGNLTSGDAHIAAHFRKIMDKGLGWFENDVTERLETSDVVTADGIKKHLYYKATLMTLQAFSSFILRFADLAALVIENEQSDKRKTELREIEKNCRIIAKQKPETFYQALQLNYFVQLVLQIESNGHSLSLGRMDQYLYPFYKTDREKGLIDDNFVMEILENMNEKN